MLEKNSKGYITNSERIIVKIYLNVLKKEA